MKDVKKGPKIREADLKYNIRIKILFMASNYRIMSQYKIVFVCILKQESNSSPT